VSRCFTRASAQQLKGLQERDLSDLDIVAVFLDGAVKMVSGTFFPILVGQKNIFPAIPPLGDVMGHLGKDCSCKTRHRQTQS